MLRTSLALWEAYRNTCHYLNHTAPFSVHKKSHNFSFCSNSNDNYTTLRSWQAKNSWILWAKCSS